MNNMKKGKLFFISTALTLLACSKLNAQVSPQAAQLAGRIADKMKDTLGLNQHKRNEVYAVNINLHNQKAMIRQQNTNMDSIRIKTQRVEKTRDSLYQSILPPPKYQLYLQKKRNLVSTN